MSRDDFHYRRDPDGTLPVGVAFTSAAVDLGDRQERAQRADAYARVSAALGVPIAIAAQVHGTDVLDIDGAPVVGEHLRDLTHQRADALVTTRSHLAVAVRVADCVPVCLAAVDGSAVAAVHAGRVGLLAGVVGAGVDALRGRTGADLVAWVGPHACASCYEVPHAMAVDAAERLGVPVARTRWGTEGIDLTAGVLRQLTALGVRAEVVGGCTLENPTLHSHRRDADAAGRLIGAVWATEPR